MDTINKGIVKIYLDNIKNTSKQLENFVFLNNRLKYQVVRAITETMLEEVSNIEYRLDNETLSDEQISDMQKRLEELMTSVEHMLNTYRENDNSVVSIDGLGNIVTEPATFHKELEKKSYVDMFPTDGSELPKPPVVNDQLRYLDQKAVESILAETNSAMRL